MTLAMVCMTALAWSALKAAAFGEVKRPESLSKYLPDASAKEASNAALHRIFAPIPMSFPGTPNPSFTIFEASSEARVHRHDHGALLQLLRQLTGPDGDGQFALGIGRHVIQRDPQRRLDICAVEAEVQSNVIDTLGLHFAPTGFGSMSTFPDSVPREVSKWGKSAAV